MEHDQQAKAFEEINSCLEINPQGRLILKGQDMVLLPRHFFRYILREVHDRAPNAFEDIYHKAGFDGARGVEGQLQEEQFIPDEGILHVVLTGSALIPEGDLPSGHLIWKEAMVGAVRSLPEISETTALAAVMEETADGCEITVRPE